MSERPHFPVLDREILNRLPLPLAQLARRVMNAKTAGEKHQAAFSLWESSIKLLASLAVAEYSRRKECDEGIDRCLENLARPALGHWWEFVRRILPLLHGDGGGRFEAVSRIILGPRRYDCPRMAGLDSMLQEVLEGKKVVGTSVRVLLLLDRVVRYRNSEIGHGAPGLRPADHYDGIANAMFAGFLELTETVDLLAGDSLTFVDEVSREPNGDWVVSRFDLTGENPQRLDFLRVDQDATEKLPRPDHVYLARRSGEAEEDSEEPTLRPLHPLVVYDAATQEFFFLNGRRGNRRAEYLAYSTGRVIDRESLIRDRDLFIRELLGREVDAEEISAWARSSMAEESSDHRTPDVPRRRIGDLELIAKIGEGGMGRVYRAWQPSLGRQVAVKCLARIGDARAERRFALEIQALGRVDHPHLVKIFTSGSDGDIWYYVMELIEGADLGAVIGELAGIGASRISEADWMSAVSRSHQRARSREESVVETDSGPLPEFKAEDAAARLASIRFPEGNATRSLVDLAVHILIQIADAVEVLHRADVLHRDIKPRNIMVSSDGRTAFLMDLGVAQFLDGFQTTKTRTGQFVGTLRYASPEHAMALPLDVRSDVWSLGVTFWELLTLRPIFNAFEDVPSHELISRITTTDPDRPRSLNPRIPVDVEAIAMKCLEKRKDRRYATALELRMDLERWRAGKPVTARRMTLLYRLQRFTHRNRRRLAVLAIGLLVAAILIGYIMRSWSAERELNQGECIARLLDQAQNLAKVHPWQALQLRLEAIDIRPGTETRSALLESMRDYRWLRTVQEGADVLTCAQADPGRDLVFLAFSSGKIVIWRPSSGSEVLGRHAHAVTAMAAAPETRRLVVGGGNRVSIWDLPTRSRIREFQHRDSLWSLSTGPSGRLVVAGFYVTHKTKEGQDCTPSELKVWSMDSGDCLNTIPGAVVGAISRQSSHLIVGGIRQLAVAELGGDLVKELKGHSEEINSIDVSPDGTRVVTASEDGTARIWNTEDWAETTVLRGHRGPVNEARFHPDGRLVATASTDNLVALWDATTGKRQCALSFHAGTVQSVRFSEGGQYLLSFGADQILGVMKVEDQSLWAALHTGRELYRNAVLVSDRAVIIAPGSGASAVEWPLDPTGDRIRSSLQFRLTRDVLLELAALSAPGLSASDLDHATASMTKIARTVEQEIELSEDGQPFGAFRSLLKGIIACHRGEEEAAVSKLRESIRNLEALARDRWTPWREARWYALGHLSLALRHSHPGRAKRAAGLLQKETRGEPVSDALRALLQEVLTSQADR